MGSGSAPGKLILRDALTNFFEAGFHWYSGFFSE
jgi:hypothetical protein